MPTTNTLHEHPVPRALRTMPVFGGPLPINVVIAENIAQRMARSRRHRTQAQLARTAGLSVNTICRVMSGQYRRVRVETIEQIARALGAEPHELMQP